MSRVRVPKLHSAGEVIRRLREEAGLSLSALADRLGWDKGRLSKYENDEIGLSTETIEEIAAALGLRPEFMLLQCLRFKYPRLSESSTGRMLEDLLAELSKRVNDRPDSAL